MDTRLEILVAISVIISSTIIAIPALPDVQKLIGENIDDGYLSLIILYCIIIGFFGIIIIGSVSFTKAIELLIQKIIRKKLTVTLLDQSEPHLGGVLLFKLKFSGMMTDGFASVEIKSPFNERKIKTEYFDIKSKTGDLTGILNEITIPLKLNIPLDFSDGEYRIRLQMKDTFSWLGFRKPYVIKQEDLHIQIHSSPQNSILIQKIITPNIKSLDNLNVKLNPANGWVCVKLYNDSDIEINSCFGTITTNIDQFPLYDYQSFLKNTQNQNIDVYAIFTLEPKSSKLLYSNIKLSKNPILVSVDIGEKEITKEFKLIPDD